MKYAVVTAACLAAAIVAASPASAKMTPCSGTHLSAMSTMIAGTPDGPHKWQMNRHLAMINTAMAKDGMRGCDMAMKGMMHGMGMMHGSKMSMMKSGM
jgi:hypothetical protein